MALTERIETLLVGNATGLVNTFKEGGGAADAFAAKTTTTGRAMEKLGLQGLSAGDAISKGMKVGAAVGGLAIAKFAFDGVKNFESMTAAVRGFQRTTGGTAEDASRLSAATQRMGIDAGTAQSAFGQLTKRIGEGKDTLAQWGVEIARNKTGQIDFSKTLENISDKYVSIKDPAERAAFASENFGKGFQSINSLLGQGKDNLQQFYDVADKHHQIFSQDDLDKGLQLSRAMKDLGTAVQGVEVEVGQLLVPALTGAAHFGTALVEVLDSIAGSSDGAKIAAVAFATAVGAAFGGPVGAAIGFATSLTGVLIDSGNSAEDTAGKIDAVTAALKGLDAQQALKAFNDLTKAELDASHAHESFSRGVFNAFAGPWRDDAKEYESNMTTITAKFKAFKDLATKDPIGAQLLIEQLKAAGVPTKIYANELGIIVGKQREGKDAADAAAGSVDALGNAHDKSTGHIAANDEKLKTFITHLDDEKKALDAVQSALLAQEGGEIARQQAVINAAKAQADYNTALASGDPAAIQDASLALQQARLAEVDATDKAFTSTDDLNNLLKDPTAIQAEIDRTQARIDKYGDADGALQSQIDKLHGYQDLLAYLATLPPVAVPVTSPSLDDFITKLNYTKDTLADITSKEWQVAVALHGDPLGYLTTSDRNVKHNITPVSWN